MRYTTMKKILSSLLLSASSIVLATSALANEAPKPADHKAPATTPAPANKAQQQPKHDQAKPQAKKEAKHKSTKHNSAKHKSAKSAEHKTVKHDQVKPAPAKAS